MTAPTKQLTITLSSHALGQLLDGARARADAWAKTAENMESGFVPDETFVCEECSSPTEARDLAALYATILAEVETQVRQQGGWG